MLMVLFKSLCFLSLCMTQAFPKESFPAAKEIGIKLI